MAADDIRQRAFSRDTRESNVASARFFLPQLEVTSIRGPVALQQPRLDPLSTKHRGLAIDHLQVTGPCGIRLFRREKWGQNDHLRTLGEDRSKFAVGSVRGEEIANKDAHGAAAPRDLSVCVLYIKYRIFI